MAGSTQTHSTPTHRDVRHLQKRKLRREIEVMLLRFKFKELTSEAIIGLFELEPIEVNNKLNDLRLTLNKKSVAQLLSHRAQAFSVEELQDRLHTLQLYRAAFSTGPEWRTLRLLEPAADLQWHTESAVIRQNLLQAFRIKGQNAVVKVITHKGMTWLMIVKKKLTRKKGLKFERPIYLCYEVGFPYIFVNPTINNINLECLLKAMQFEKHKVHKLDGKNVVSMLNLLKYKTENSETARNVAFQPAEAEVGAKFVDFSKKKARQTYVDRVYKTKESVQLETFVVNADAEWRGEAVVPEMAGERFPTVLTFKSKDLVGMFKGMVTSDMFVTPLPEYVQTILSSGKNNITISHPHNAK